MTTDEATWPAAADLTRQDFEVAIKPHAGRSTALR
jgi:hypothetical protein